MENSQDTQALLATPYKVYVTVNEDRLEDGTIIPRAITWEDGVRYEIDRASRPYRLAARKTGGTGLCYQIRVNGKDTHLWLEDGNPQRWFVSRRGSEKA